MKLGVVIGIRYKFMLIKFIQTIEHRQGQKISCPEEIAFRKKWIDAAQIMKLATPIQNSAYGRYLMDILQED